uniref:Membrane-associated protein n=1 Tax=Panagrellus redivivus TaxID=6233 RepID=A0A7E4VQ90_PANRE
MRVRCFSSERPIMAIKLGDSRGGARGCLILALVVALLPVAAGLTSATLFGTDDYALVGVADCSVTVQTKVEDNVCAYHLSDQPRTNLPPCPQHFTTLLVASDNQSTIPPRLLSVFKVNQYSGSIMYSVTPLELPSANSKHHTVSIPLVFNKFTFFLGAHARSVNKLTGIAYDNTGGNLYIFHELDSHVYVDVYMLHNKNNSPEPTNIPLYQFEADRYFCGVQWSSDPYTQRFYYHKLDFDKENGRTVSRVFSIPFNAFGRHLTDGTPGQLEKDFTFDSTGVFLRKQAQVTNGIIYSTSDDVHLGTGRHRYLGSHVRTVPGWRCPYTKDHKQDAFFVLTGWELCKLRDGYYANRTTCNLLNPTLGDASPHADELGPASNGSGFLWAITIAVIVNAVILLVILCVVCRRKEMDIQDKGYYAGGHSARALLTPEEVFQQRRTTSSATDF